LLRKISKIAMLTLQEELVPLLQKDLTPFLSEFVLFLREE
jgi:hypothetical protein